MPLREAGGCVCVDVFNTQNYRKSRCACATGRSARCLEALFKKNKIVLYWSLGELVAPTLFAQEFGPGAPGDVLEMVRLLGTRGAVEK